MKVMGVAKALDWTGCLLHGRDGIPGTGDLFYFSRKSLSHKTREKEGHCYLYHKSPETSNDGG